MKLYYVIPSNDKGSFGADRIIRLTEAKKCACDLYNEMKDEGHNFRVDVFLGNEDNYFGHLDPVYTIKEN